MKIGALAALAAAGVAAWGAVSLWKYRQIMPRPESLGKVSHPVRTQVRRIRYGEKEIFGVLLTPADVEGPLPAVICAHGFGVTYQMTRDCLGKSLAMSGYAAYCFDFCGGSPQSRSTGEFHDMTVPQEKEDLLEIIDQVKTWPEVDRENLFLMGESQGGLISGLAAVERQDDLQGLILYYPAFSIPEGARKMFRSREEIPAENEAFGLALGGAYYEAIYDLDPFRIIGGFEKPVLILHGDADDVIPHEVGLRAAEVYPNARFVTLPGEVHGFKAAGKRTAARLSYDFLEEHRKQAGEPAPEPKEEEKA